MAGGGESVRIQVPVDGVASKHASEEHDLGEQKNPHAQRGGFELLVCGIKMMPHLRMSVDGQACVYLSQREPPPRSCTRVPSRRAVSQNCRWAAAWGTAPTPGPSRPMDFAVLSGLSAKPRLNRSSEASNQHREWRRPRSTSR